MRRKRGERQRTDNGNDAGPQRIPADISECEQLVKTTFNNSSDIVIQTFATHQSPAMIVYVDGLANKDLIDRDIILPLKSAEFDGDVVLALRSLFTETDDFSAFIDYVLKGNVGIFYGDDQKAYIVEFKGWESRSVTEPDAETAVRGPKEGFTENFRTNSALIRRKIKTPKLTVEHFTLGKQTQTAVGLVYIDGIVNQDVLTELKNHLSKIDTDQILESGQIEQYICKNTFSPVSGIGVTQKPDVAAQKILEGRIAVLCDGTPHALTVPKLFLENLQTAEDYYNRTVFTSIIRVLRSIALFITVLFPGLAIAILTYHPEMIPSIFLISIVNASQRTPMPLAAEVFFLMVMFELLRESGSRLPKAVGSAITIVGSLIIGEAAVNAGIISEPMVIVGALTAITGFLMQNLLEFIIIYRALFWLLGSTMGLIGIGSGIVIMMTQLISTHSFGIPVLSSFSKNEMKDTFLRFPLGSLKFRPSSIAKNNIRRRK